MIAVIATSAATSANACSGRQPIADADAATISGDGVSPAAIAAASGSPPGSDAASWSTDAGTRGRVALQAAHDRALEARIDLPPMLRRRRRHQLLFLDAERIERARAKRLLARSQSSYSTSPSE